MLFRPERHILWALALSLAIHIVLFIFALKLAPWQAGEFMAGKPILVQLHPPSSPATDKLESDPPPGKSVAEEPILRNRTEPVPPTPDRSGSVPERVAAESTPNPGLAEQFPIAENTGATNPSVDQPNHLSTNGQYKKDYQEYAETLRQVIEKNRRYPVMAIRGRQQGTVMISFILKHDGELISCHVARSCGHQLLDRAAIMAIQSTGHYPPFPDSFAMQPTEFIVPVTFRIDQQ